MFASASRFLFVCVVLVGSEIQASAKDYPNGYAPKDPLMEGEYPSDVTEEQLAALPLDDPLLWKSYGLVSLYGPRFIETNRDYRVLKPALADLRRRGNEAIPLLLKIMERNHNNSLEHSVPFTASNIGTVDMNPFLDYLRTAIRTRPDEINAEAAEVATKLFYLHGTPEDIALMEDLGTRRPFIGESIAYQLNRNERSAEKQTATTHPNPKELHTLGEHPTMKSEPPENGDAVGSRRPWFLWSGLAALTLVVAALAFRRLK